MSDKYVKLEDVESILELIRLRDQFHDWSDLWEEHNSKFKIELEVLKKTAITIKDETK